jgi:hypothetical protein
MKCDHDQGQEDKQGTDPLKYSTAYCFRVSFPQYDVKPKKKFKNLQLNAHALQEPETIHITTSISLTVNTTNLSRQIIFIVSNNNAFFLVHFLQNFIPQLWGDFKEVKSYKGFYKNASHFRLNTNLVC